MSDTTNTPMSEHGPLERACIAGIAAEEDCDLATAERMLFHQAEHGGDCTKEPHTCGVCYREDTIRRERAAITEYLRAEAEACPNREYAALFRIKARRVAAKVERGGNPGA